MMQDKGSKTYLFSIVLVAVLGGLLFGYDTAVISGAERGLQACPLYKSDAADELTRGELCGRRRVEQ